MQTLERRGTATWEKQEHLVYFSNLPTEQSLNLWGRGNNSDAVRRTQMKTCSRRRETEDKRLVLRYGQEYTLDPKLQPGQG